MSRLALPAGLRTAHTLGHLFASYRTKGVHAVYKSLVAHAVGPGTDLQTVCARPGDGEQGTADLQVLINKMQLCLRNAGVYFVPCLTLDCAAQKCKTCIALREHD
jgi:hypothetical protein